MAATRRRRSARPRARAGPALGVTGLERGVWRMSSGVLGPILGEDAVRREGPAMVRGSGRRASRPARCARAPGAERSGWSGAGSGAMVPPADRLPRFAHWTPRARRRRMADMEVIRPSHQPRRPSMAPLLGRHAPDRARRRRHRPRLHRASPRPCCQFIPRRPPRPRPDGDRRGHLGDRPRRPRGFLLGTSRLARILAAVRGRDRADRRRSARSTGSPTTSSSRRHHAARRPRSRSSCIGPFGGAVIRELPPAAVSRIRTGRWRSARGGAGSRSRPARSGGARRRTRPPLARPRRRRLRRQGLCRGLVGRPDRRPDARLRGPSPRTSSRLDRRPAAAAQPDRGPRQQVLRSVARPPARTGEPADGW